MHESIRGSWNTPRTPYFHIKQHFLYTIYKFMLLNLLTILFVLLVLLFTCIFAIARLTLSIITVQGHSMFPTLLPNDRILVLRHYPSPLFRRGQIVVGDLKKVLDEPVAYAELRAEKFIKRLVGLPGDKIVVHIAELHEEIQNSLRSRCDVDGNLVWHIPQGHCFVRGDGIVSGDSIIWGPIPIKFLVGIVLAKLPSQSPPKILGK